MLQQALPRHQHRSIFQAGHPGEATPPATRGTSRCTACGTPPATPAHHLRQGNTSRARHWWIRTGTLDTNTAHTVVGNLAAITTGLGDTVNSALYWDGGHAVNFDSPDLMSWIGEPTGYRA